MPLFKFVSVVCVNRILSLNHMKATPTRNGGQSSTWGHPERLLLITLFSACRYLHPFQRYSWSKCEVAQNCTKFWTVFAFPNSRGDSPPKIVPTLSCLPWGTSPGKVWWGCSPSPKVIGPHTPNFKPNFDFWLSPKVSGGTPIFVLNYKVPPSSHCLAKFGGDRTGSEILPLNHVPPIFFGGGAGPPHLRPPKSKCPHFQSCVKVSGRSPQPSRRYSAAKCHKEKKKETTAKHKPTWNCRSGWPNQQQFWAGMLILLYMLYIQQLCSSSYTCRAVTLARAVSAVSDTCYA